MKFKPFRASAKKPPAHAWKPSTKAKAAKAAASDDEMVAPQTAKKPAAAVKSCKNQKKQASELSDSSDEGKTVGENNGGSNAGRDADEKVEVE